MIPTGADAPVQRYRGTHNENLEQAAGSRAGSWSRGYELSSGRNRHHLTVDPLLTADRKAPWALKVRGAFFVVSSSQNEAGENLLTTKVLVR